MNGLDIALCLSQRDAILGILEGSLCHDKALGKRSTDIYPSIHGYRFAILQTSVPCYVLKREVNEPMI